MECYTTQWLELGIVYISICTEENGGGDAKDKSDGDGDVQCVGSVKYELPCGGGVGPPLKPDMCGIWRFCH